MAPAVTAADPKPNAIVPSMASQPPTRAYVTFLPRGGDDVHGVVGLVKGLRNVNSKYRLVVAVLPDFPEKDRKKLVDQGCVVRKIEPLHPPENQIQFAMGYDVINYSKLRIWEFVKYTKMIYLNGDIQVYDNIDRLFDLPDGRFYAVMDCFCKKTWSPLQHNNRCCQQRPDLWPEAELGPCPAPYFNAGMFVFEPNLPKYTYRDLLKTLKDTPPTPFAEQDFLNKCFKDIYKPIPPFYNLDLTMLWKHPEKIGLDKVKVAGREWGRNIGMKGNIDPGCMKKRMEKWFEKVKVVRCSAAGSRPWRYTEEEENKDGEEIKMLVAKKWLEIYDNVSLDYQNCSAPVAEAGLGDYNTGPSAA